MQQAQSAGDVDPAVLKSIAEAKETLVRELEVKGKRPLEGGESAQPPAKRRKRVSFADGAALQQVRILPALNACAAG